MKGLPQFNDDPVAYLRALRRMVRRPRHMRAAIGFDHTDLEFCAAAWNAAAIAAGHNGMRNLFLDQKTMYERLTKQLKDGEHERGEAGVMLMEDGDWPHATLIDAAITALEHAGIRSVA